MGFAAHDINVTLQNPGRLPELLTSIGLNSIVLKTHQMAEQGVWGPPSGKRYLIALVDDLNCPKRTLTGTIPAVDFLTGFVETQGW